MNTYRGRITMKNIGAFSTGILFWKPHMLLSDSKALKNASSSPPFAPLQDLLGRKNIRVITVIYNFDVILRLSTYLPNNDKDTFLVIWEKGMKSLCIWRVDLSPWKYGKVAAYISAVRLQNNICWFWSTGLEIVWHHITVFHNIVKQQLTEIL